MPCLRYVVFEIKAELPFFWTCRKSFEELIVFLKGIRILKSERGVAIFGSEQQYLVYVVVNFLFQLIFIFPLFWGMVMYANEFKTKEKQKLTEIKK